jgi:hypothetical protein
MKEQAFNVAEVLCDMLPCYRPSTDSLLLLTRPNSDCTMHI